jgi:hypothetical protein
LSEDGNSVLTAVDAGSVEAIVAEDRGREKTERVRAGTAGDN